jgi:hypothetical protein
MYKIKRITKEPGTALRVQISQPASGEAGLAAGGTFFFSPAGEDGDTQQLDEQQARAIMEDHGLAVHFACDPALPGPVTDTVVAPAEVVDASKKKKKTDADPA